MFVDLTAIVCPIFKYTLRVSCLSPSKIIIKPSTSCSVVLCCKSQNICAPTREGARSMEKKEIASMLMALPGTLDETVPFDQAQRLYETLEAFGVEVSFLPIQDAYHNLCAEEHLPWT